MTDIELQQLKTELIEGRSQLWDKIYLDNYAHCTNWLVSKYQCSKDIAKDFYQDTLLKFRSAVLRDKFKPDNLQGWLIRVMGNDYKKHLANKKRASKIYTNNGEHISIEESKEVNFEKRFSAYQKAMQKLSEACQKLLKAFYLEQTKLKDLQVSLQYSSYDVIKDKRRRCFNQLKKFANDFLTQNSNT